MEHKLKAVAVVLVIGLALLIGQQLDRYKTKIEVKQIELQSTQAELQELELDYQQLNNELMRAVESNETTQAELDDLKEQKDALEREQERLEAELQAKRQSETLKTRTKVAYAAELTGNKYDWLSASIIPESEWHLVDWLVTRESGWNPTAQNPTSTAYGLKQFLNSTWAGVGCVKSSEPVYQLNCGHKYVMSRYGSWQNAKSFWEVNRWY